MEKKKVSLDIKKKDTDVNVVKKFEIYENEIKDQLKRCNVGISPKINEIIKKIKEGSFNGMTVSEMTSLVAETFAYESIYNYKLSYVAGSIIIKSIQNSIPSSFSQTYLNNANTLSKKTMKIIKENCKILDSFIDVNRDFMFDYFGIMTLKKSYLMTGENKEIIETPQYLFLRVAIGIHGDDLKSVKETYDMMSQGIFIHASPTLFNSGTVTPQMSSCFLVAMEDDSIEGIYDTLKTCALISKTAGGIGISISNIRAKGGLIKSTHGASNGIVPMLQVFNNTARYVDQGGGKRKGAFAIYLSPWHADIFDFLELKKNHGKEEMRARDLFYALWVSDLFMTRAKEDKEWSLFCPNKCPGLNDVYGDKFESLYKKYENDGKAKRVVKARTLWSKIIESQIETGTPYMVYKDACNKKSNQKNLGTIKSSNLCTEIIQYTSKDEVAVCNLASIALPKFIRMEKYKSKKGKKKNYDFKKLFNVVKIITRNLNKVIDKNFYPVKEAKTSNLKHRPIGIGVQGLADTFAIMEYSWDSEEARKLNKEIFETIYYAALYSSNELAKRDGPYLSFKGSPASKGILQFHMWNVKPSNRWDWSTLIKNIKKWGLRNSLLVSPMPTASTSQILGNNECIEPYTCNIYSRRVLSGEFPVINKHLVNDLMAANLWDENMCRKIIANDGSIQQIAEIPKKLKSLHKNVWEISQEVLIDMAADRGPYVDQSQSLNIFIANPSLGKMTSMHFYGWAKGLKTGMYYLRSLSAVDAIKYTIDPKYLKKKDEKNHLKDDKNSNLNPNATVYKKKKKKKWICNPEDDACVMCGS